MRFVIAPHVAVVLSTSLVFLVIAPQESYAEDMDHEDELDKRVFVEVWMHAGDPKINGCGLEFQARTYSGKSVSVTFPDKSIHKCGSEEYEMQMMSQGAMYETNIRLGNDRAKDIEIHAMGWRDTFIEFMCITMGRRTIVGGPHKFCIDNALLKACKALTNRWSDIDLDSNDMKLTRTWRGTEKIIFSNVQELDVAAAELAGNLDNTGLLQKVCDRIDLKRGSNYNEDDQTCTARKMPGYVFERKNPDGCNRFEE